MISDPQMATSRSIALIILLMVSPYSVYSGTDVLVGVDVGVAVGVGVDVSVGVAVEEVVAVAVAGGDALVGTSVAVDIGVVAQPAIKIEMVIKPMIEMMLLNLLFILMSNQHCHLWIVFSILIN